jgi:hypothetical protein
MRKRNSLGCQECETDEDQQRESGIEVDAKRLAWRMPSKSKWHISWNVCTPLSDALKYDIYNREMDSMTMEDFGLCLSERQNCIVIIDLEVCVRKECQLQTPATTEDVMDRLAAFFHEPLDAEDIEEYKTYYSTTISMRRCVNSN